MLGQQAPPLAMTQLGTPLRCEEFAVPNLVVDLELGVRRLKVHIGLVESHIGVLEVWVELDLLD